MNEQSAASEQPKDVEHNIRDQILTAARERFSHYGYPKTTIAELAGDCQMSAGNIYRFFKGKIDIATELARQQTLEAVHRLELLMNCSVRSARQRLEDMLFEDLRYSFHLFENKPKIVEMAQIVLHERPEFYEESLRREHRAISRILQYGVEKNEFQIDNIARAATAIQAATLKYRYAQLTTNQTLPELERELAILLTYLTRGLAASAHLDGFEATQIPPETAQDFK